MSRIIQYAMRPSIFLSALIVPFLLGAIISFVQHQILKVRIAFAEDQISIICEAKQKALEADDPKESAGFLEYAINYYPSGTKQAKNSRLDRLVEMVRSNAVNEMLADLRRKTAQDFGNEPTNWFQHYPPPRP